LSTWPGWIRRLRGRLETIGELFRALWWSPVWWLTPFCVLLVFLALILSFLQAVPAAAPFLYPLF
jgi:hypothetical protein